MQTTALPLLIEQSRELRDKLAAAVSHGTRALQQAQATLDQLGRFREDTLARSPTGRVGGFSADRLHDWQLFMTRLDEALDLQRAECERRAQALAMRQQQLADGQRRLMAFEALAARQAAERQRRQARQAQRDSDEFAARATRVPSIPETQ
ncbi:flagellar export protein FliJ [Ramlibacter sp. MAHUQ-53]|uniref:flagellar export protein FliJ n=1 Tax=unclassified Ramlibacter TaxID=2617605 RepID=UPI003636DC6B